MSSQTQQRRRQRLVLLTIFLFVFAAIAAQSPLVSATHISLRISTAETHNPRWEPIEVHYILKNTSNTAVFVPKSQWDVKCPSQPHFWARLVDSRGESHEPGYGGDCLGDSSRGMNLVQRMNVDALLLRPGESTEGKFIFHPEAFSDLQPGKYRLEATLYGWNALDPAELPGLAKMGHPILIGKTHASIPLWLEASR